MKILKLFSDIDKPEKHNYEINYGLWNIITPYSAKISKFDIEVLNDYDFVFLPGMGLVPEINKRWKDHMNLFNEIKKHNIKKILFANDICYGLYDHEFFDGIDFVFYRDLDKNRNIPKNKNYWLPWSIDTKKYTAKYGGKKISFNCSVSSAYPLRQKISKIIKNSHYKGKKYIKHLQECGAGIHTDSELQPTTRAKVLEFAACGTQIISNKTNKMNYYFPDELIIYFNDIEELRYIIKNFKANIEIQKKLRQIVITKHDHKTRAKEVIEKIKTLQ